MEVDEVLVTGLDRFGGVLSRLTPGNGSAQSPCDEWDARAVAGHVLTVLESAVTTLLGGDFDWSSTPDPHEVGGDDPQAAFSAKAEAARAALVDADLSRVMTTPMGEMTIGQRLSFPAMDLHLHAWDLGTALGIPVELEPEIAEFVHRVLDPLPEEMKRSQGVFGPELEPPSDATPTERLMSWAGREVR